MGKYDKKLSRQIAAYERRVDAIYKEAAREAAALGVSIDEVDGTKPFAFADYPQTKKRANALFSRLKAELQATITNGITVAWALANDKNDALCRQVLGDRIIGKLSDAQRRRYFNNNEQARKAFAERVQNGMNLSDRVWKYTNQFKEEIEMGLDLGLGEGKAAEAIQRDLRKYLQHPDMLFRRVRDKRGVLHLSKRAKAYHPGRGVYRSSYKNARRLAATETNIAYHTADYERWQSMDFVVGIRVVISNNHPTPDICDDLSAPLGSTATKGQGCYPKDFKFTGWHPHCRCNVQTILKTEEEMAKDAKRIMEGKEPTKESVNKVETMPENFVEWVKNNKDRIETAKQQPYFVHDNKKSVEKIIAKAR